jgi:hypothetical protein
MKSNNYLIVLSIVFLVFAGGFSVVFWGDVSLVAKIGLFVLGFGSGVTAGQWFAKRHWTHKSKRIQSSFGIVF